MISLFGGLKGFYHSFCIQLRVIYALLMREIITRYGRHNVGFLWLFIEPMIFTLLIAMLWQTIRGDRFGNEMPIVPFAVIGYSVVLCWRNSVSRTTKAISANSGLLYHRNVTVIDVFLARVYLEVFGATVSFMALSVIFHLAGFMPMPDDFLYMAMGWFLMIWFAIGLSFTIGAVCEMSDVANRLWSSLSIIMFPISGVAFFVHWLPEIAREFILYIPMVHLTEMIRHGYYGDVIPTYENIPYLVWCNMILSFMGLVLVKKIAQGNQ